MPLVVFFMTLIFILELQKAMAMYMAPKLYRFTGGTKEKIVLLPYMNNTQITIGGRASGLVKLRVRPFLALEIETADEDGYYTDETLFEYMADADINLGTIGGKRTYTIPSTHLTNLMIDDVGNGGDFWVSVWQFTQEK